MKGETRDGKTNGEYLRKGRKELLSPIILTQTQANITTPDVRWQKIEFLETM